MKDKNICIRTLRQKSRSKHQISERSRTQVIGHIGYLTVIAVLLFVFVSYGYAQTSQKKAPTLLERISELEDEVSTLKREISPSSSIYSLPSMITLCDKKISLYKDDLRERFEREFFQLIEHKGLMTIIVKRYLKYFHTIHDEIQKMSLPSDLIYLVIVESNLNPRALSKSNAAGLWQFIQETGRREGLYINEQIDERYDIKKATRSALTHLKKLYEEFGDWFIAMAAYNAGQQRLREVLENQNTKDFFEMYLPEETERYVIRIASMKEIITNRGKYGISIDKKELYKTISIAEVTLEFMREVHTNILSKCMDVPYKTFREYNLHIRKYQLSSGTYHINVPHEKKEIFFRRLRNYEYIHVIEGD